MVWGVGAETSNDLSLPGSESQQATDLLASRFPPQQNGSSPIVFHVTKGKITDAANKQAVESSYKAPAKAPHVASAPDPFANAASGLVSKDATTAFTPVLLDIPNGDVTEEIANRILDTTEPARKAGVGVSVAGNLGGVLSKSPTESSEVIGLLAAMLILALTFGSLVAMGMPIITAVVGLAIGLGLIGLLGHVVTIPTVGPTLATMIGLGVGIDYALFLVTKHRDQTAHGMERHDSIARAVATSGGAIVFAGSTVIIALLSLWVADIPLVASLGYASAVAVLTAVLAAITLLPAILSLAGRRPDALAASGPGGHRRDPEADHRAAGLRPPGQQVRARLQRAPADRDRAEPSGASQPGVRGQVQPGQGEPGRPGTQAEDADRQVQLAEVPAGVAGPETPAPAGTGAAARPAGIPAAPGRPVGVAAGRPPAPAGAAGAAGAAAPGRATPAPAAPRAAPAAGRGAAGGDPGQSQGPGRAHRPGGQGQDPGPGAHQGGRPGLRGGAAVGGVPGRQAGAGRCAVGPGRHSAGSRTGRPGGRAPATGERAQRPGGRPASAGRRTGGRGRLPAAAGRLAAEAGRCPQEATAAG